MVGNTYVPLFPPLYNMALAKVGLHSPTHLVIGSLILGWHKYTVCEFFRPFRVARRSDLKVF
jgi:hypothetical protein